MVNRQALTARESPHGSRERQQEGPATLEHVKNEDAMMDAQHVLFGHPVLFSKRVNASFVDTLLSPESTSNEVIAAIVVPTAGSTRIKGRLHRELSLAVDKSVKKVDAG